MSTANTIEARPRGPNQARKATVGSRARRPASASATGSMRTTVTASTPKRTGSQLSSFAVIGRIAAPKMKKVKAAIALPSVSATLAVSSSDPARMVP